MPLRTVRQARRADGGRPAYLRRRTFADRPGVRFLARAGAVAFLTLTIFHGLEEGGFLKDPRSPLYNLEGRIAGAFGQAAERISITGLKYHSPRAVLTAIGVESGGSLLGFNPEEARRLLENLDWVKRARLAKVYPNGLSIEIEERAPIALWQTEGEFYPVDEEGVAISSLDPRRFSGLLLITGEGANGQAKALVNQLAAHPRIRSKLRAAAYVGRRRWNFYFASGLKVLMPEKDLSAALERLNRLDAATGVLDRAVETLDLRQGDRYVLRLAAAGNGRKAQRTPVPGSLSR